MAGQIQGKRTAKISKRTPSLNKFPAQGAIVSKELFYGTAGRFAWGQGADSVS